MSEEMSREQARWKETQLQRPSAERHREEERLMKLEGGAELWGEGG